MHNSNHKLVLTLAIFIASLSLLLIACSKPSSSTGEVKTNESTQYNNANSEEANEALKQSHNNIIIEEPLSEAEMLEVNRQSQILQKANIEDMDEKTADTLANYFVRCERLENTGSKANILSAKHDIEPRKPWTTNGTWEYWVITSDTGTEYWLAGFNNGSFVVNFIYRDSLDGDLLYGYYQ